MVDVYYIQFPDSWQCSSTLLGVILATKLNDLQLNISKLKDLADD